jgi:hypothetical protein
MSFGVTVDFNADVGRFLNDIDRLNSRIGEINANLDGLSDAGATAFKFLAAGVTIGGISAGIKEVADLADEFNDLSLKTGVTVEKLSGLQLAANQSGTDLESVAAGINKLSKNIGTNADEFAKLGITAKDPLVAFEQLADIFVSIEDPQLRAAVANQALGKSWQDLAPLLSLGGKGIAEIVDKGAKASGITKELAEASDEFNDTVASLEFNLKGLVVAGLGPAIPILNSLAKHFDEAEKKTHGLHNYSEGLATVYRFLAREAVAVATAVEGLGLGVAALGAKINALAHLDFRGVIAIEEAFGEDKKKLEDRFDAFKEELYKQQDELNKDLSKHQEELNQGRSSVPLPGVVPETAEGGLPGAATTGVTVESNKSIEAELLRHNKIIQGQLEEEVSLYEFRTAKLDAEHQLGLVADADYFKEKERLQKDQLAATETYIDQEINAMQFLQKQQLEAIGAQIQANEKLRDNAKTSTEKVAAQGVIDNLQEQKLQIEGEAQGKVNALVQQKIKLERESQIATLQNAADAKQALGDQAAGLTNINGLLAQYNANIIGMSKAQAELNTQIGGTATAADVLDKSKIFVSDDGKSFSDRPTEVGITLDLSEQETVKIQDQLTQLRDQAIQDSAILLGVDIDQAAAIAKIGQANSAINESLAQVKPITLGMDVDQSLVISAAQRAREAAQAAIQPIIIPVVYQAQNSPSAAAPAGPSLTQAALAAGGR